MAEHLVSLKRSAIDSKSMLSTEPERDSFPLSLYIEDGEIAALNLGSVKLGDELTLIAMVKVVSVSSHETEGDNDVHRSVTLDLTEGATQPSGSNHEDRAEKLFGGG